MLLVFTTIPKREDALYMAHVAVKKRLAACVNIAPKITSVFRWQNEIKEENEFLLIFKTTPGKYSALEKLIKQEHIYTNPEIAAVEVKKVAKKYLDWVNKSCK